MTLPLPGVHSAWPGWDLDFAKPLSSSQSIEELHHADQATDEAMKQVKPNTFAESIYLTLCELGWAGEDYQLKFESRFLNSFGSLTYISCSDMPHAVMWGFDYEERFFLALKLKYTDSCCQNREFVSVVSQKYKNHDDWTWDIRRGVLTFMGSNDRDLVLSLLKGQEVEKGGRMRLAMKPVSKVTSLSLVHDSQTINEVLSRVFSMPMFTKLAGMLPTGFFTEANRLKWQESYSWPVIGNISHKQMAQSLMWGIDPLKRLFIAFKLTDGADPGGPPLVWILYQKSNLLDVWCSGGDDPLFAGIMKDQHIPLVQEIIKGQETKINQFQAFDEGKGKVQYHIRRLKLA